MYATSAAFDAALNAPNRRWHSRVEVLSGGQVQVSLDMVLEGRVSLDDVAVRRSGKITMRDITGTLTPATARDLLAPRGTELRLFRGLYVGTEVEWVPLGVFGIVEPEVIGDPGGTVIKISARDRVDAVRKRRFAAPWRVAGGTPTHQAIAEIVTSRLDVPTRITATGHTVPESTFDALSDPWDAVRDLAEADALIAYFDPLGTLVVEPDTEVATGITYEPGDASLLLSSARRMNDEDTYSGVIVTGEHPDETPIHYELWDTDPKSPTYADGIFGRRPFGFSSPLVNSVAKAQAAAETIFKRVTRMRQYVDLATIGHPGHEVGDRVVVRDPASKTLGNYVVTGAQIPLRPHQGITLNLRESADG